jgi:small subunit ribosomal protein S8
VITITFKAGSPRGRALSGLRRISRPGLRVYARKSELPRVLGGLGVAVISTSQGLMTGQTAQRMGLGGEVVAFVW